jgi:hypothetical protein
MQEEEKSQNSEAQETEETPAPAAEGGEAQAEPGKPKKAIPKVAKGAFKKPEKAELGSMKGKFAQPKDGPVKKQPIDRFRQKSKINPKIIYAFIGVVVVLFLIYFFLAGASSAKLDPAYMEARYMIVNNPEMKKILGIPPIHDSNPTIKKDNEIGYPVRFVENSFSGSKGNATLSAKMAFYRNKWRVVKLTVKTKDGKEHKLVDKELTPDGIISPK